MGALRVLAQYGASLTKANIVATVTPAHVAAENGNLETLRVLHELIPTQPNHVKSGMEIGGGGRGGEAVDLHFSHSLLLPWFRRRNQQGATPLFTAALAGHLDAVRLLVELQLELGQNHYAVTKESVTRRRKEDNDDSDDSPDDGNDSGEVPVSAADILFGEHTYDGTTLAVAAALQGNSHVLGLLLNEAKASAKAEMDRMVYHYGNFGFD